MRRKQGKVALLVTMSILLTTFASYGIQADEVNLDKQIRENSFEEINVQEVSDEISCGIDGNDIPEMVRTSLEKSKEIGCDYVRMYEEEEDNLYSIIVGNDDGKRVMYSYPYPVKYKDKDGVINDISLQTVKSDEMGIAYEVQGEWLIQSFLINLRMVYNWLMIVSILQ